MAKSITMKGHKEIIEAFQNSGRLVQDVGKFHLRIFADETVEEVKRHTLNAGAVDTNEFIQGIHKTIDTKGNSVIAVVKPSKKADKYAAPLEFGSKPHRAPIDALKGWAERHGIPVWAVWHKIARFGTEPRWMWRDSFEVTKRNADKVAEDIGNDIIRKI